MILVGHSMGGMAVTQAAELRPERIARLVYVTAFLPKDGESLQYLAGLPENPVDIVVPNCEIVPPDAIIPEWAARAAFYHRCAEEDAKMAVSRLNPQPLPPLGTPVSITPERAGSVERHYVACTDDKAIPIALQRRMIDESPCASVVDIDADHSPFLSAREDAASTRCRQSPRRSARRAVEPQLGGALLDRRDDERDVLVELEAELLGARADVLAIHRGRERLVLELLLAPTSA